MYFVDPPIVSDILVKVLSSSAFAINIGMFPSSLCYVNFKKPVWDCSQAAK